MWYNAAERYKIEIQRKTRGLIMSTVEQYNAIRASITSNLETIKTLLAQANNLHNIVDELDGNVDAAEKEKLNASINNIYKSIDLLVVQSDTLFQTFIVYANSMEPANK